MYTKAAELLPFSAAQGRENITKDLWAEIGTGKDHSDVTVTGKTDLIWGNEFNFLPITSE